MVKWLPRLSLMTQLADRPGAPGRERGGRRWGRLGPWWRTGGQPASPLEASDELVEGAQVVDVKPALLLPPVAEMHDRTGVEEPLLAVDRCAEALDTAIGMGATAPLAPTVPQSGGTLWLCEWRFPWAPPSRAVPRSHAGFEVVDFACVGASQPVAQSDAPRAAERGRRAVRNVLVPRRGRVCLSTASEPEGAG